MKGTGIAGYSVGGSINLMAKRIKGLMLISRYDYYDPNTTIDSDEIIRTLNGLGYRVSDAINLAVDLQTSQIGSGVVIKTGYLHSVVNF